MVDEEGYMGRWNRLLPSNGVEEMRSPLTHFVHDPNNPSSQPESTGTQHYDRVTLDHINAFHRCLAEASGILENSFVTAQPIQLSIESDASLRLTLEQEGQRFPVKARHIVDASQGIGVPYVPRVVQDRMRYMSPKVLSHAADFDINTERIQDKEFVIIGAGQSGCTLALQLKNRGARKVTMLTQHYLPPASELDFDREYFTREGVYAFAQKSVGERSRTLQEVFQHGSVQPALRMEVANTSDINVRVLQTVECIGFDLGNELVVTTSLEEFYCDRVIVATGYHLDCAAHAWSQPVYNKAQYFGKGFPYVDAQLRPTTDTRARTPVHPRFHVTGRAAALQHGPASGNLAVANINGEALAYSIRSAAAPILSAF